MEQQNPNYPRWVYSESKPQGMLVHTVAQLHALEGEWFSHSSLLPAFHVIGSPAKPEPEPVRVPEPEPEPEPQMPVENAEPEAPTGRKKK